jgi:hypothetical protein
LAGGKRQKFYHLNGRIAGTIVADDPNSDCALGLLLPPFEVTRRIANTSLPKVGDTLRVHATRQSRAHNVIVRSMCIDGKLIGADIVSPGTSDGGDCGAAYTTPSGSHLVGIHCEGHPAGSPNHSICMIRASNFSFDNGRRLEFFPNAKHRFDIPSISFAVVVVVLACAALMQFYF